MIALLRAEFAKLGGSLGLIFAVTVPALPAFLVVLAMLTRDTPPSWIDLLDRFTLPLWVMFLYPMAAAAFCTLIAQIEYRARSWDHLFALPFARWQVMGAKLMVIGAVLAIMTVLVPCYVWVAGTLTGWATGTLPTGSIDWGARLEFVARLLGAAACMSIIQAWAALRFANFVTPLAIGIGGTLVGLAVAMTGTGDADWFPWVLPLRAASPESPLQPVVIGLCGGLLALIVGLLDLSRKRAP